MVSLSLPQIVALGLWAKFMSMSQNGGGNQNGGRKYPGHTYEAFKKCYQNYYTSNFESISILPGQQPIQQPRICIQRVPVPVPFPIEKIVEKPIHVQVPVNVPYPVRIRVPVKVPVKVPQPYPVRVNVPQPIPYPIPVYQPHPTSPPSTTERPTPQAWTPPPPPPPINVFVTPPRVIVQRPEPQEQLQEPDIDDMYQAHQGDKEDQERFKGDIQDEQENCADEGFGEDEDGDKGGFMDKFQSKFSFGMKDKFQQGFHQQKWIPTQPFITQQQIYPQNQIQFPHQQIMQQPIFQQPQQQIMQQPLQIMQQPLQQPVQQQFGQLCVQTPCVQRPSGSFKAPFQAIHGYDLRGSSKNTGFGWPNFFNKNKQQIPC